MHATSDHADISIYDGIINYSMTGSCNANVKSACLIQTRSIALPTNDNWWDDVVVSGDATFIPGISLELRSYDVVFDDQNTDHKDSGERIRHHTNCQSGFTNDRQSAR